MRGARRGRERGEGTKGTEDGGEEREGRGRVGGSQ